MRLAAILALLLLTSAAAIAQPPAGHPPEGVTARAVVDRVIDGDTVDVNVTLRVRVRLLDCWAPEVRGPEREEGERSKAAMEQLLPVGAPVIVHVPAGDTPDLWRVFSFGRVLGHIWQAGAEENVSQLMVAGGYATAEKQR